MVKQPFDINRDLGVPKVNWDKVDTRPEGPKLYPSELVHGEPVELEWTQHDYDIRQAVKEFAESAKADYDCQNIATPRHVIEAAEQDHKPLEEPIGETPKFNPVTQQFELPE